MMPNPWILPNLTPGEYVPPAARCWANNAPQGKPDVECQMFSTTTIQLCLRHYIEIMGEMPKTEDMR